jgi:hypothetical protein
MGESFLPPWALGKLFQPFGRLRVVDPLQFEGYRPTLFPVAERHVLEKSEQRSAASSIPLDDHFLLIRNKKRTTMLRL